MPVSTGKQMQDLVRQVLHDEPSYYDIAGYSAYVKLLGHLLAGCANQSEQDWAQEIGLLKKVLEKMIGTAIRRIDSFWHKAEIVDFIREVLVALDHIFKLSTSLGAAEDEIYHLVTSFIRNCDDISVNCEQAWTLLSLVFPEEHT
jgi:hypothetical protein